MYEFMVRSESQVLIIGQYGELSKTTSPNLHQIKSQSHIGVPLSRWERAVWSAIEIASSVDLLGRCANWSGSRVSGIMV